MPEKRPTTTSSAVIPSEKTNNEMKPHTAFCEAATQVSTTVKAGAPHGAATSPEVAPMRKAPPRESAPSRDAQATTRVGALIGITSSIASAAISSRLPKARYAQGFDEMVPNSVPVRPARRPSDA